MKKDRCILTVLNFWNFSDLGTDRRSYDSSGADHDRIPLRWPRCSPCYRSCSDHGSLVGVVEVRVSRTLEDCALILRCADQQSHEIHNDRKVLRIDRTAIHIDLPQVHNLQGHRIPARRRSDFHPAMVLESIGRFGEAAVETHYLI